MVRTRDRIIAMVIAIAFFGVSFALSFIVIWELYKGNKEAKTVNGSNNSQTEDRKQLKGTKLANFTPIAQIPQLQTVDLEVGTGNEVKPGDMVTVDYTGALAATGVIFESSLDTGQPASFGLDGVIAGWTEGIPGMKEGGTRRLLIPAAKAYGANPRDPSVIPPNSDLVFDVTLKKVGQ